MRSEHPFAARRLSPALVALLLIPTVVSFLARPVGAGEWPDWNKNEPHETGDDPPAVSTTARSFGPAAQITFGRFTSVQVNVTPTGENILNDAANEPTIAVNPTNPMNIVIGWRQFDDISSDFREAGVGYTTDGGQTWTMGTIDDGIYRSDPVLSVDASGTFYYNSLSKPGGHFRTEVFRSYTGGSSWETQVYAYGGDKQWMTIDRTGGPGHGRIYQMWGAGDWGPPNFNHSVPSPYLVFSDPSTIPNRPVYGTFDVASDGTLYLVGCDIPPSLTLVSRSTDAATATIGYPPTFTTQVVDLGGNLQSGNAPNPTGLMGQLWIAVDRSGGPRHGWVYVLGSVRPPAGDPLDVMFVRSIDGGATWSTPVRVNSDAPGPHRYQWFGTMSLSPNGRLDAVWNDTRGSADSTMCALYYSASFDGGVTWTANEQATPAWRSTLGWPAGGRKIGDYYHMVSDSSGAHLAYAATFNTEQDVYYLRIASPALTAVAELAAAGVRLHPAQPNPFRSATTLRFDVPAAGARVRLEVFDTNGRRVARLVDGPVPGGPQIARWLGNDESGTDVPAGVYLCRLEGVGAPQTAKVLRIR